MKNMQSTKRDERANLQAFQNGPAVTRTEAPAPRNPGPIDLASETLGYLSELEALGAQLRERLYGEAQPPQPSNQTLDEMCLEGMLHSICQRSAMAVSELRTMLSRL